MLDLLIRALAHVLVPMFAAGMIGSTIVVAITFVHDIFDFVQDDGTPSHANDPLQGR